MKTFPRAILLFNLFMTLLMPAFAQVPVIEWQKTFGGSSYEQAEAVIETFDHGIVAAGISTSSDGDITGNHGAGDFWIIKSDPSGNLEWEKSFGGSGDDGAFSIEQTADSGYVLAGTSTSVNGDVTANHGLVDYWILKIDASGNIQWQKSFGGNSTDLAYDIHQTSDHGYIIAGYTTSANGDVTFNHGFEDFWIVKTDSTGTLQWQKTFGGSQDERAYSIHQTNDGGYIAAGYTKSTNGDVTGNHGDYDFWVIKLNGSGSLDWQKTFGGTSSDQAHSVQQTSDDGYIVAGMTASQNGDVTVNHGFEDLWMIKLDESGSLQWEKSLGGSGVELAYQVRQLSSGDYLVAGSSYSTDGEVTGNHGGYDCWVVKTDDTANIIWEISLGGSSFEEAYAISPGLNDSYIVAGGTLSDDGDVTGNHGDFDYWVVKLNDAIPLTTEQINGVADSPDLVLNIAPNPFSGNTNINYELKERSEVRLELLSVSGQKISTLYEGVREKGKYTNAVTAASLNNAEGIFLVRLITNKGIVNRMVVEK